MQVRLGSLRQLEEEETVTAMEFFFPARFCEFFAAVFADGLQHAITRLTRLFADCHERFVDQSSQQAQHLGALNAVARADGFGGFQSPAVGKHGKPA